MNFILRNLQEFSIIGLWCILWLAGGLGIARFAFRLPEREQVISGIALGLIVETWLANLLTLFLPVTPAFWLAAVLTLIIGIAFSWGCRPSDWLRITIPWSQIICLVLTTGIFTGISRGLAIYDDYAHLPTLSMMAAGDLPPHFALDPSVPYGYHYFLMLFAAQLMRLGDLFPWNALDFARGLSFGLMIGLTYLWVARLTFSKVGGLVGAMMAAFGMGTRWILLLLPEGVINTLGQGMKLIGSGRLTGATLYEALNRTWGIEGAGPIGYPFAYANGIAAPGVMNHGPNGSIGVVIGLLLLMVFNRWKGWRGAVVTAILLAASLLISETGMLLLAGGFGVVVLIQIIQSKGLRISRSLWLWLAVMSAGCIVGFLQGGALKDITAGLLDPEAVSYQTVAFRLIWPPEIVSSHLGVLSLIKPGQLIVALLELGPSLLAFPLLAAFGLKALRASRWYEAALVFSGIISLLMVVVEFAGSTGVRNTSRLYQFSGLCLTFFVPLVWMYVCRRGEILKTLAVGLGGVIMFGGILLAGIQIPAMQKPVYSYFLSDLDVKIERDYWNKLEADALVFDPIVSRAATIFARGSNSGFTWYKSKPEWEKLAISPDPYALRAGGYSYAYFDQKAWDEIPVPIQKKYTDPCVKVIKEVEDWRHDFRKLIDVRECVQPD
ncbi:MAG: hypothetical protein GYA15_04595 [Leptolinea sp.]|nr:hypothetical protein [Leptolinea sp.]